MKRMRDFNFLVRERDGSERTATFYARDRADALAIVKAWARKRACEILVVPEDEEQAS